ncbi:LysR family transcriptional regulator [Glacieibacterium frigidum]|uniref:LysR family transcriptional regulator n=1 Tax=Glacieibacterium frigidum TaxID=2593303 RepID=A0A552U9T4_9SPHN|nr:LysR family transcriptional regulator [Glacieibacterium frigidum]TRW14949.1 LysR family transcriptional regulator [Glacieibacterium frigidum]
MDRIDALRLLLDVSEAGSFSSVARQRAIATSTVALAVSQLEQELGVRLMARSTRKLVFTHEGELLLADARRIVSDWDTALSTLRDDGPLSGPIRITATNDFGRFRLRPLLDAFQERQPGVHIALLLSDSPVDLIEEHIDLAIRSGPLPDSTMRARVLIRGPRVVCASPRYWRRAGMPAHPSELANHNCIVLARPGAPLSTWAFRVDGKILNMKVRGDRQASDGDVLREWGVAGAGVIFKNQWDVREELAAGTLTTALDDFVPWQVDLFAVHAAAPTSRRVAALIEFLADALRDGPAEP